VVHLTQQQKSRDAWRDAAAVAAAAKLEQLITVYGCGISVKRENAFSLRCFWL